MTRVFPLREWEPSQNNARHSVANYSTTSDDSNDAEIANTSFRFRQRLSSFPLQSSANLSLEMSGLEPQMTHSTDGIGAGKKKGLRRFLQKASASIKGKQRRHSHVVEDRPSTAWKDKLRPVASFQRKPQVVAPLLSEKVEQAYTGWEVPIPGSGKEPPVIPRGNAGAAARATAAAQNEFGRTRSRQFEFLLTEDGHNDQESGIGIAAISTVAEPSSYAEDDMKKISRVDFIGALPTELAIQILAHFDHKVLYHTSLVSKEWWKRSQSPHVWREAFLREKSKAYAMGRPVQLGAGLGLPPFRPESDWKGLYRAKQRLERNWRAGEATPAYLNGHLDSIYCVQFDEYVLWASCTCRD